MIPDEAVEAIEGLARDLKGEQAAAGNRITSRTNAETRKAIGAMPLFSERTARK